AGERLHMGGDDLAENWLEGAGVPDVRDRGVHRVRGFREHGRHIDRRPPTDVEAKLRAEQSAHPVALDLLVQVLLASGEEQESLGDVDRQLRDDDQLAIRRYARGQEVAVTRPHLLDPAPRLVSRDRLGSTKRRSLIDETGPSWLRLRRTGHVVLVERTETRSGPGRVAALPAESPRVCWRLQLLRDWGHETGKEVLP